MDDNSKKKPTKRGLLQRLADGTVLCAEGYLFELERRGYLQAGAFVPEVVLEHPEVVAQLHREFLRAGSDVMEAFTYYAHREKLRAVGKEDVLEPLQRDALAIAKEVAAEARSEPPLVAGNICNTNIYSPGDRSAAMQVRKMFEEQITWAFEAEVDFVIAETIRFHGEAQLALESIKRVGLPAVVMLVVDGDEVLRDGVPIEEACRRLEQEGADVVGLNCSRGPITMLPLLQRIRNTVTCHVAGLPVPYRTTLDYPTFQSLDDPDCDAIPEDRPFPTALDSFACNRYEMAKFALQASKFDVRFVGACCGAGPHHVRSMAEALGRHPEASRYSPDMSKHWAFGSDSSLKADQRAYAETLRSGGRRP
jgi:betaine-homocysteine S-methyltransferase